MDGVNSFAPEIQNILDLVYFQISQNQNHEFLYLKLVMRSILPTDQKELVSFGCLQRSKNKTNFLKVFSKIQMIIFLKISYYFDFIWFFVKYKGRFVILVVLL
jgi:hypothetical protein